MSEHITNNHDDDADDDSRGGSPPPLAPKQSLVAHAAGGTVRVRVREPLVDVLADDLYARGSSRSQVARTEDGGWVLHEERWDDWEDPEVARYFRTERDLLDFLWGRRHGIDLALLDQLGRLTLTGG